MIAYVHIGTPKTGTTTIQNFLFENRSKLKQNKFLYPLSIEKDKQHWKLVTLSCEFQKNKINNYNNIFFDKLKSEIDDKITTIFSSEGFVWSIEDKKNILGLKNLLISLGFTKIFILLYIRNPVDLMISFSSQDIKNAHQYISYETSPEKHFKRHNFDYKWICESWGEVFGKENLIVRLFDKNEFYQGDLLKDFIHSIGLEWDDEFIIPPKQNESLDLLGIELLKRTNKSYKHLLPSTISGAYLCTSKDPHLKFQPPKEVVQSYIDYFEESNEWVRKEFFPHKERLFPKKDLSNYKENYELKEMKPEYWDKIAEFIAYIVKTKNQTIIDKTNIIQNKDKTIAAQTTQINSLQIILKDSEAKFVQMRNLNNTLNKTIQEKTTQLDQLQSKLSFQTQYGTAKQRIQNQLSYKLGQAMIVNSKSLLGYIAIPIALLSITISHKQEQKIYQEKIKKDPSLKLPPLESYPDYKEALKEKECLTYKLGEALIKASNNWYGGGYIKLLLEIRKLKREFRKKANHA
ncbi:hypothetical protein [Campylobacter coli]|nr:hypothetical protein [Campylobacter coli]MCK6659786.1 hypothetical protein [Campylobacter coli]MED7834762.1 hypothetical protein [Campylobacter coli]MED7854744.1 hypothetical protein [Campylobacter coli]MED7920840.1 hypothetical protein [Campylobacter coli]MED7922546.1 hypothetical protein [Campylobacter coli]